MEKRFIQKKVDESSKKDVKVIYRTPEALKKDFNVKTAKGNKEEVDLSIKFQKMISNFCKTGNPSIEGLECKEYDIDNRYLKSFSSVLPLVAEKHPELFK